MTVRPAFLRRGPARPCSARRRFGVGGATARQGGARQPGLATSGCRAEAAVSVGLPDLAQTATGPEQGEDRDATAVDAHLGVAHLTAEPDPAPIGGAGSRPVLHPATTDAAQVAIIDARPVGYQELDAGVIDVERDISHAWRDFRQHQVEHGEAAGSAHVEAAGGRPVAQALDGPDMAADVNGFTICMCPGGAPSPYEGVFGFSRADTWRRRGVARSRGLRVSRSGRG